MKRKLQAYALLMILPLLSAGVSYGEGEKPRIPEHHFQMGFVPFYLDYSEPEIDIDIDGIMYGAHGTYTYHKPDRLSIWVDLELALGELEYNGQTWSGVPIKEDSTDFLMELRGVVGYHLDKIAGFEVIPFGGIAYRYWNDRIGGPGGYEREIGYLYSPLGLKTRTPLSIGWTWGFQVEFDLFLGGRVKSHLSDVNPGYNDPEVDQDLLEGYGIRASLEFAGKLREDLGLSIEPFLRYWHIGTSNSSVLTFNGVPETRVVEPENKTKAFGLRLSLVF